MNKEREIIKLKAQIDVLLQLEYTIAYKGNLENIQTNSYVLYSDILKILNDKRIELKNIK